MTPLSSLRAVLWTCGATLRTFRELGRFFRFDISIQDNHKLIVTGPYAYVRHPAYSGMLMANVGWFLWNGASGSWVRECGFFASPGKIFLVVYVVVTILSTSAIPFSHMSKEDEVLKKRFGSQWDDWAKRVSYLVIPGVYWKKSSESSSWLIEFESSMWTRFYSILSTWIQLAFWIPVLPRREN